MLPFEFRLHTRSDGDDDEEAWEDRFYSAIYQLLLAGLVLAGGYNAPF